MACPTLALPRWDDRFRAAWDRVGLSAELLDMSARFLRRRFRLIEANTGCPVDVCSADFEDITAEIVARAAEQVARYGLLPGEAGSRRLRCYVATAARFAVADYFRALNGEESADSEALESAPAAEQSTEEDTEEQTRRLLSLVRLVPVECQPLALAVALGRGNMTEDAALAGISRRGAYKQRERIREALADHAPGQTIVARRVCSALAELLA